ncbi:MAG: ABC transporter substrate-binding protein [Deltaproteobacteria bacterium]|nr:ABC transporter substrate-binding protein [Candidatus Deferrimicrobiaceae bacterium]
MIRKLGMTAIAAVLAGLLCGGASAAPAIRLGVHEPQTGSLAKSGAEKIKGIRLAAEEFEKKNKVKVDLLVYDDESSPPKAVAAVEKLAGVEKVHAIVGGFGSNLVGPASEAAERYDIPYMTTGAVDTKLSAKKFKNFFRLNYMPGYAEAQSGTIRDLFKAKKVGILYNSLSATTEIAEVVKAQLEKAGIAVPVFEKFEKGTTNYKPILLKVKDAGCEVLLVQGYFPDYVGTLKDAKILNLPVKAYVGSWGIGTPEFKRELGPLSEYVYGAGNWEIGTSPTSARAEEAGIVSAYRAKYKEDPSSLAMLAYLSTEYLLEAIVRGGGKSGSYSPEKTRAALRALDVVGPVGRVAFDEKGDPKYFTSVLFQLQKGNQVVVYPRERATGNAVYPAVPWGGK